MAKKRLDVLLVERGLEETRTRAQARILAGEVIVNDHRIDKPGTKFGEDVEIRLRGKKMPWVSRGGLKLDGALQQFKISCTDRVALDAGASTGGFTDVLLTRGARYVHCIDVGYGQLAWKIRSDERINNLERTHIVKMAEGSLEPIPDLGVVDVSFISLTRVLPAMQKQLAEKCEIIALIKPQFEVGRDNVGKGGIVRDAEAREAAIEKVLSCARAHGFAVEGKMESPIQGAEGNVEYLAHLVCRGVPLK